jgi:predicted DNA-binding transcriptional regulator YafY
LDRIHNLITTDDVFQREPALEETAKRFDDVYGLVYEPDNNPTAPIEEVRLKVSPSMLPYLHSLPIHSSQVIEDDVITLHLIINPELENRIMSYGEHIEVLSPLSLRESIKNRIQKMLSNYK